MSIVDNKIAAPVSFADVNQILGASKTDLGQLCTFLTIKMWAKYKPVRWVNPMTTDALNANKTWNTSVAEAKKWWKGYNGNYGISVASATINVGMGTNGMKTALSSLLNIVFNPNISNNGWTYERPNGGTYPYRLADFNQYNHGAANPIRNVSVEDVSASITSIYQIAMELMRTAVTNIDTRDYIIPEDITTLSLHLGFAIFKYDGTTYSPIAWVTDALNWEGQGITYSDQTDGIITDDGAKIFTRLKDGATYYAIPIFTTYTLAQDGAGYSVAPTDSNMKLVTVPNTSLVSFTAHLRQTTQIIGVPELSDRQISNLWKYGATLYLNSTYTGYSGGMVYYGDYNNPPTPFLRLLVVNEDYTGETITSQNCAWNSSANLTAGSAVVGSSERKSIFTVPSIDLEPTKSWRVIVSVSGEETTIPLRTPSQPIEPSV